MGTCAGRCSERLTCEELLDRSSMRSGKRQFLKRGKRMPRMIFRHCARRFCGIDREGYAVMSEGVIEGQERGLGSVCASSLG